MSVGTASRRVAVALAVTLAAPLTVGVARMSANRTAHQSTRRVVEIRAYNLKPGARDRFHQLFLHDALPMLERWRVDVVAYGPSLHDNDSYYLMRAYPGVEERQRSEDAFYGSDEWKQGPREAILACIDTYATVVIAADEATIRDLHAAIGTGPSVREAAMTRGVSSQADLDALTDLNLEYIRSVQKSDVTRFREILAGDFLCSLPDGSLLDRDRFLEHTARPVTIANLAVHDVNIRLMGDFAIIHARTTYTLQDGRSGAGRYTDVWARREGRWLAVSAHVTRN